MNKTLLLSGVLLLLQKVIVPLIEEKIKVDLNGDGKIGNTEEEYDKPIN